MIRRAQRTAATCSAEGRSQVQRTAAARCSTSSRAVTWNGTAPDAEHERVDAEGLPLAHLLPHLLRRCRRAGRCGNRRGRRASRRRAVRARAAARTAGARSRLVLAARARRARASATPSPDRDRRPRTRASSTASRSRYASGVHAQHVFHPSACAATSRSNRSPLPPTNTRGRGCWQRRRAGSPLRGRGGTGRRT